MSIAEMDLTDFDSSDTDETDSTDTQRRRSRSERRDTNTDSSVSCPHASQTALSPQPAAAADDWDGQARTHAPTWDESPPSDAPTGPQTDDGDPIAWVADLPDSDKPTHNGTGDYWEPLVEPFCGASIVRPDQSLREIKPENGPAIPAHAIAYVVDGEREYRQTVSATRVRVPKSYAAIADMDPAVAVQTLRSSDRAFGIGGTRCEQLIRLLNGSGRFDAGAVSVYNGGQYPSMISVGDHTLLFTTSPVQPPPSLSPPDWELTNGSVRVTVPEATPAGRRALTRLQSAFAQLDCELIRYDGPGTDGHRFGIDPVTAGSMDGDSSESPVTARTSTLREPPVTAWDQTADTGASGQTPAELADQDAYAQVSLSAASVCRAGSGYDSVTQLSTALNSAPTISNQHCQRLPEAPYEPGDRVTTEDAPTVEREPVVVSIDYSPPATDTAAITNRAYGQYVYQLLVDDPGYASATHKVVTDNIPVIMRTPDGIRRVPTDRPPQRGDANARQRSDPAQFTSRL